MNYQNIFSWESQNQVKSSATTVWQHMERIPRWLPILLLAIIVLIGLFFGTTHLSFAKTLVSPETCATAPLKDKPKFCNGADPIQQQCVTPDTQTLSQNIVASDGKTIIGRVDLRYSPVCQSWWGRAFDYRHLGAIVTLGVGERLAFPDSVYSDPDSVYSDMVFKSPGAQAPVVTGILTINGKADPKRAVTLP